MRQPRRLRTKDPSPARQASSTLDRHKSLSPDWDQLLRVERRRGLVVGRLTRPPAWRWCKEAHCAVVVARILGVDSLGTELDVALAAYDDGTCARPMDRIIGAPVGDVVVAEGQIEYRAWSTFSVRMIVRGIWPIDSLPRLTKLCASFDRERAIDAFVASDRMKTARDIASGVVEDPFGHMATIDKLRTAIRRRGLQEDEAIDNYAWDRIPDTDPGTVERDPAKRDELFHKWESERSALIQHLEMAFDGDMIAAMIRHGGFGAPGSESPKDVMRGMLNGVWNELVRLRLK